MKQQTDARMRDYFLGWQCRVRQLAARQFAGRPTDGMRPRALDPSGTVLAEALTVLIVPIEAEEHTTFFRFQSQRTNDPKAVYKKGLEYLQERYFQAPGGFRDEMTALFQPGSTLARSILAASDLVLEFEEYSQTFKMICMARKLPARDPAYRLTLWHNRMFNPAIPNGSVILGLTPQWRSVQAHPEPP